LPFFVMATQNPVETKGVYPLPEAQVDRFLFKALIPYPKKEYEVNIVETNADNIPLDEYGIEGVINLDEILQLQRIVKHIYISDELKRYILHIIGATRNPKKYELESASYIQWGGSPRATIYLGLASRATALLAGRTYVKPEDVPRQVLEKEKEIYKAQLADSNKPKELLDKILEGKLNKYKNEVSLLTQPFVKDPTRKVKDIINEYISVLGENIVVERFARFEI